MSAVEIDSIIDQYERSFRVNSETDISDFVPPSSSENYNEIVTELIRVELELNWSTQRRKTLAKYSRDFPSVVKDPECFDRIAFEEYRLRVSSGEAVTPNDYQSKHGIKAYHGPFFQYRVNQNRWQVDQGKVKVARTNST